MYKGDSMMKLVVLDGYTENPGDLSWAPLETLGELTVYDRTDPDDDELIRQRIGDAEIVITNKTPLRAAVLQSCPHLRLVAVLATGYNVVDCAAAKAQGVPVCNVPGYGTMAVAQYAIALLLELCSRVGHHAATVRQGHWAPGGDWCYWDAPLTELAGKTAGIFGYGHIGRQTGRIAAALGMQVLACTPHPPLDALPGVYFVEKDELLRRADVILLHCPLTPATQGLICRESIAQMKPGVLIVNNARGGLIVAQDLAEALAGGRVGGAALDVLEKEPPDPDDPLLHAPNCLVTPHISWAPIECRRRILDVTAQNIRAFFDGAPQNIVNL